MTDLIVASLTGKPVITFFELPLDGINALHPG